MEIELIFLSFSTSLLSIWLIFNLSDFTLQAKNKIDPFKK